MITRLEISKKQKQLDIIFYATLSAWAAFRELDDRENMGYCNEILAKYDVPPKVMLDYYKKAIRELENVFN